MTILVLADHLYHKIPINWWVTPFGNRRITGEKLLPDEYRRFLRPSSAKQAKASIVGLMSSYLFLNNPDSSGSHFKMNYTLTKN